MLNSWKPLLPVLKISNWLAPGSRLSLQEGYIPNFREIGLVLSIGGDVPDKHYPSGECAALKRAHPVLNALAIGDTSVTTKWVMVAVAVVWAILHIVCQSGSKLCSSMYDLLTSTIEQLSPQFTRWMPSPRLESLSPPWLGSVSTTWLEIRGLARAIAMSQAAAMSLIVKSILKLAVDSGTEKNSLYSAVRRFKDFTIGSSDSSLFVERKAVDLRGRWEYIYSSLTESWPPLCNLHILAHLEGSNIVSKPPFAYFGNQGLKTAIDASDLEGRLERCS